MRGKNRYWREGFRAVFIRFHKQKSGVPPPPAQQVPIFCLTGETHPAPPLRRVRLRRDPGRCESILPRSFCSACIFRTCAHVRVVPPPPTSKKTEKVRVPIFLGGEGGGTPPPRGGGRTLHQEVASQLIDLLTSRNWK